MVQLRRVRRKVLKGNDLLRLAYKGIIQGTVPGTIGSSFSSRDGR
jgi:hypothetical protein